MDGYTYLFLQTAPIIAAVALIFCLMGMYFGASKYRTQLKEVGAARDKTCNMIPDHPARTDNSYSGRHESGSTAVSGMRAGPARRQNKTPRVTQFLLTINLQGRINQSNGLESGKSFVVPVSNGRLKSNCFDQVICAIRPFGYAAPVRF